MSPRLAFLFIGVLLLCSPPSASGHTNPGLQPQLYDSLLNLLKMIVKILTTPVTSPKPEHTKPLRHQAVTSVPASPDSVNGSFRSGDSTQGVNLPLNEVEGKSGNTNEEVSEVLNTRSDIQTLETEGSGDEPSLLAQVEAADSPIQDQTDRQETPTTEILAATEIPAAATTERPTTSQVNVHETQTKVYGSQSHSKMSEDATGFNDITSEGMMVYKSRNQEKTAKDHMSSDEQTLQDQADILGNHEAPMRGKENDGTNEAPSPQNSNAEHIQNENEQSAEEGRARNPKFAAMLRREAVPADTDESDAMPPSEVRSEESTDREGGDERDHSVPQSSSEKSQVKAGIDTDTDTGTDTDTDTHEPDTFDIDQMFDDDLDLDSMDSNPGEESDVKGGKKGGTSADVAEGPTDQHVDTHPLHARRANIPPGIFTGGSSSSRMEASIIHPRLPGAQRPDIQDQASGIEEKSANGNIEGTQIPRRNIEGSQIPRRNIEGTQIPRQPNPEGPRQLPRGMPVYPDDDRHHPRQGPHPAHQWDADVRPNSASPYGPVGRPSRYPANPPPPTNPRVGPQRHNPSPSTSTENRHWTPRCTSPDLVLPHPYSTCLYVKCRHDKRNNSLHAHIIQCPSGTSVPPWFHRGVDNPCILPGPMCT